MDFGLVLKNSPIFLIVSTEMIYYREEGKLYLVGGMKCPVRYWYFSESVSGRLELFIT